jgi:outer membrane lipoprotein-sorting protein
MSNRRKHAIGAATLLAGLAFAGPAAAQEAKEIASQALDNNMFATANAQATIDMEISKDGKVVRRRQIRTLVKRHEGLIRSFVEFVKPTDVAGTKFLSLEVGAGDTQQFIYLPAFKKVKRVVGAQRGKSFMGTDFSYADLEGRDVDDTEWKRLPDDTVKGEACYVIEGRPKKEDQAYGRTVIWVHKANKIPLQSEFFDKDGSTLLKRMTVQKLNKKDGRWIATDSVMETVRKGTSTRLVVAAIDLSTNIPDAALTREALEH